MEKGPPRVGFWEALFCVLALLGAVLIAGAIGGISAPIRPHAHPTADALAETQSSSLAQEDLVAQQEMANWAFGAMIGGFLTMFGSFIALFFVYKTLHATQETLREARERNAIEMRAYIVVIPKGIEQSIGNIEYRGQIEIHNIGRSPAHDVSCKVRMKTSDYNESNFRTQRFKVLAKRTLLPDARMRQGTKENGLTTDFLDLDGHIYVYGRVDYTDHLSERRSTMFCHRYNRSAVIGDVLDLEAVTETRVLIPAEIARHHIHGNNAD